MRNWVGWLGTVLGTVVGLTQASVGCSSDSKSDACPTGNERCECYPNGTCNDNLSCLSNHCVLDSSAGGATGGSPSIKGGSNGNGGTSGGSSSNGGDEGGAGPSDGGSAQGGTSEAGE